ncbi:helix-turn-helix transcriptional regulator [Gordonia amicalis]|uniref:Helix-turn-helix transcriptional regulator n=1 Tax=Gordonia amicalis TaxID=89053 RepID=A0ABU4DKV7_9ACTN|nr:helix-turn-helix transcriptional regulator [Gordonia amicalis]MDV6309872.1 helix-turn-helix transcriptional regulator [Gordonia amicalis]MDV7099643.1 helix-turn-helix transcriptional regulator [Gordonia amicalis]
MKREKDEASVDAVVDGRAESGDHVSEDGPTAMAVDAVEAVEAVATAAQDAVTNAAQDIGAFIRSQRVAAKVSLRQLAERAGVSNPYLSQIERGLRKPSADVLAQIAKGLRVSAEVLYVRAGILEERPASPVRDALIADDSINERQKQMLLEIYESFRKENSISPTDHE